MSSLNNNANNYTKQSFDECSKVLLAVEKNQTNVSKPIMTKYEFNAIISQRTTQLASGAISFVDIPTDIKSNMDLRKVALEELRQNKIPYIIKRPLPNGRYEFVRIKDLNMSAVKYMMDL
jgi:DNA-directed RNA polymerase I, II, and III subunit RPABC2